MILLPPYYYNRIIEERAGMVLVGKIVVVCSCRRSFYGNDGEAVFCDMAFFIGVWEVRGLIGGGNNRGGGKVMVSLWRRVWMRIGVA